PLRRTQGQVENWLSPRPRLSPDFWLGCAGPKVLAEFAPAEQKRMMLIGVMFAGLAALCGVAANRVLRGPLSLAPLSGLASLAVLTTWATALGLPPVVRAASVVCLATGGLVLLARANPRALSASRANRLTVLLISVSMAVPALL